MRHIVDGNFAQNRLKGLHIMKSHLVSNWALSRLDVCEKVLFFFKMSTTLKILVRSRFWKQILQKFRSKYVLIGIPKMYLLFKTKF